MQVNLVGLRRLVVDNRFHSLDIETTRCDISGKKEGHLSVSKGFDAFDTL
jgi:hypothetical protein